MEFIINFYHDMPTAIRVVMDWFFATVVLRGLIGGEITAEVKRIWAWSRSERPKIIMKHYLLRSKGLGHNPENILACQQGKCISL